MTTSNPKTPNQPKNNERKKSEAIHKKSCMKKNGKRNSKEEITIQKKKTQLTVAKIVRIIEEKINKTQKNREEVKGRVKKIAMIFEKNIEREKVEKNYEKEDELQRKMVPKMKLVGPTSKEIRQDTIYGAGEKSKVLGIGYDGTPRGREWDLGSKNDPRGGPFSSNSTTGRKGSLAIVCDGIPKGRACELGSKNAPQADLSDLNSTSGKKGGLTM